MPSVLLVLGIYGVGCLLGMLFFLFGRVPALNEREWRWPVIFFWPLLVFWPLYALAGGFVKWKNRHPEDSGH